jgi:anti-sigma B factor antagonist
MVRPTKFEISDRTEGTTLIVAIAGELDLSTVPELAARLQALREQRHTTVTLDLGDLTFMDSSGLRLLIELDGQAKQEGWQLTLRRSRHESANTVFRVTGADAALPFEE